MSIGLKRPPSARKIANWHWKLLIMRDGTASLAPCRSAAGYWRCAGFSKAPTNCSTTSSDCNGKICSLDFQSTTACRNTLRICKYSSVCCLPVTEADEDKRKQASLLSEIGAAGAAQEVILHEIALRREPADLVFPPLRKTKDIQRSLPEGRLLLAFFTTTRGTYGFLFSRDKYAAWPISTGMISQIRRQLQLVLRDMGNYEQNHQLGQPELASTDWKKNATKLRNLIFSKSNVDLNAEL